MLSPSMTDNEYNKICLKRENMEKIKLRDNSIKLGQALKLSGVVESGSDAKEAIQEGHVKVNHIIETRRGKQLQTGDVIEYKNHTFIIEGADK
jgi:ribosome-associated protein